MHVTLWNDKITTYGHVVWLVRWHDDVTSHVTLKHHHFHMNWGPGHWAQTVPSWWYVHLSSGPPSSPPHYSPNPSYGSRTFDLSGSAPTGAGSLPALPKSTPLCAPQQPPELRPSSSCSPCAHLPANNRVITNRWMFIALLFYQLERDKCHEWTDD